MAISDAFLRGHTVTKQEEDRKLGMLQSLINYQPNYGVGYAGRGSGGTVASDPLARVNEASRRYEAEQDRETARQMAFRAEEREEEAHESQLEQEREARRVSELQREISREQLDQARAQTPLQEALLQEKMEAIDRRRAGRKIYEGYITGDAGKLQEGLNERFGMREYVDVQRFGGAAKIDPETGQPMKDEEGNIIYEKEEPGARYRGMERGMEVFQDVDGNWMIQYPTESGELSEPVPLTPKTLETFLGVTAEGAMQPYGGPGAGEEGRKPLSAKDRADLYIKSYEAQLKNKKARHEMAAELCAQPDGTIDMECYNTRLGETADVLAAKPDAQGRREIPPGGAKRGPEVQLSKDAGAQAAKEFVSGIEGLADNPEFLNQQWEAAEAKLEEKYGPHAKFAFQDYVMQNAPSWFTGVDHSKFVGKRKGEQVKGEGLAISKINPNVVDRSLQDTLILADMNPDDAIQIGDKAIVPEPESPFPGGVAADVDTTPPPPWIVDKDGNKRRMTWDEAQDLLTKAQQIEYKSEIERAEMMRKLGSVIKWLNTGGREGSLTEGRL